MRAWTRLLVLVAARGWRLPAATALLVAASWLTTSDVVNTRIGAGWFLDSPAILLSTPNAVTLAVLPGFLLLTGDLVPRVTRSGLVGYAAARLASGRRWWLGTSSAMVVLAGLYTCLTIVVSIGVGTARLGVVRPDGPARAAVLAAVLLPRWLTEPSPEQAAALLLPLFGALVVIGMVPAVVSLWTSSMVVPALPVAGWLLASLIGRSTPGGPPLLDVVAAVDAAGYGAHRFPDGSVFVGRSLVVGAVIAAGWLLALVATGWWRVARDGVPLRG